MKKVFLYPITMERIFKCFKSEYKYNYLGISYNIFSCDKEQECYKILQEFIEYTDSVAKPKYIPRWFLNLLYLFGNDWSIVRCRNQKISKLHGKLTKGIMITDIKIKWNSLRIYGNFTQNIYDKADETCQKIDKILNYESK